MPKKVFAVTNVKIDGGPDGFIPAGAEFDVSRVTKEQALELHAAGAIEVRIVEDEKPAEESTEAEAEESTEAETETPVEE